MIQQGDVREENPAAWLKAWPRGSPRRLDWDSGRDDRLVGVVRDEPMLVLEKATTWPQPSQPAE